MPSSGILRLGKDNLLHVLQYLDAESLARLCCTCQNLRSAAETPSLWKTLVYERWYHVHAASFHDQGEKPIGATTVNFPTGLHNHVVWKYLFASGNGWEPPRLRHTVKLCGTGIRALQPLFHPVRLNGGSHASDDGNGWVLALGRDDRLDIWHVRQAAFIDVSVLETNGSQSGSASASGHSNAINSLTSRCIRHQDTKLQPDAHGNSDHRSCQLGASSANQADPADGGSGEPGARNTPASALPVLLDSLPAAEGARSIAWLIDVQDGPDRSVSIGPNPSTVASTGALTTTLSTSPDAAAASTLTLAIGTRRGKVEWYRCDACCGSSSSRSNSGCLGPASCSSLADSSTRYSLQLLNTTACDNSEPLVELHLLPASRELAAVGTQRVGTGSLGFAGGGLLAALQRADSALDWVTSRNAVQLYDVASQRHMLTIRDTFESHQFVCCCSVRGVGGGGGSGGSDAMRTVVDPHVLLVGSVHGSICGHCARCHLPSLCSHKPRSATAALYTLDVRCGLTQRFGLQHCSLYPRLTTAREHYVFTSHAGTAVEVYDRRVMSVPLYTCSRMPWPSSDGLLLDKPEGEAEEEAEEDGAEEGDEEEEDMDRHFRWAKDGPMRHYRTENPKAPGFLSRPAAAPNRHHALWLDSNDDVLLGRSDNGTLWVWDLSMTLGWARGPDRSGLWHWMYENGPLEFSDQEAPQGSRQACADVPPGTGIGMQAVVLEAADEDTAGGGAVGLEPAGWDAESGRREGAGPGREAAGRQTVAMRMPGQPICLGSVPCEAATPLCSLATGSSTAFFNFGMWKERWPYVVGSMVA